MVDRYKKLPSGLWVPRGGEELCGSCGQLLPELPADLLSGTWKMPALSPFTPMPVGEPVSPVWPLIDGFPGMVTRNRWDEKSTTIRLRKDQLDELFSMSYSMPDGDIIDGLTAGLDQDLLDRHEKEFRGRFRSEPLLTPTPMNPRFLVNTTV